MATQVDLSTQLMDQILKDQQTLAKQMEITGQAVAQLSLNRQQFDPEPSHGRFCDMHPPHPHT